MSHDPGMYDRIYAVVRRIPRGYVATYGQIARIAGGCGPRNVGYAMSSVPFGCDVPWQRVVNAQGRISVRSNGGECSAQRQLLESEGISFGPSGRIDLDRFGWEGPEWEGTDG